MTDCNCGVGPYTGHPLTGYPHADDCPFKAALRRLRPLAHATDASAPDDVFVNQAV